MEAIDWVIANRVELTELVMMTWAMVSLIVAVTPTKKDDRFLARLMQRLSFLAPKNVPRVFSIPGRRDLL